MIVGERKPFDEISGMLKGYRKTLLVGCGTCVKVCFAGGDKETALLASQLRIAARKSGKKMSVTEACVERQCEGEFIDEIAPMVGAHDVVVSMACGVGVQMLAERFSGVPVLPAVNTTHYGGLDRQGVFTEKCQGCGDCVLDRFGGICPVTRCSKSIFNGPCGGSMNGRCEVDSEIECGWQAIIDRMRSLGKLDELRKVAPPKNWRSARHGGPRKTILEAHILS